ncbi:unnamed protein product [Trichogramma brassicae]|uniref:Uncharacterized protein n=1 Tax=Trichogramma brassicae TaxID=86971 RepID=A0A6H5IG83_9HYME|nr:unnamed protein product [Trichogramma brassicae]
MFFVISCASIIIWLTCVLGEGARGQECYDDGNEFCIDQNDILSVDLLPGSFIMMDQFYSQNKSRSSSEGGDDKEDVDGSFVTAFDGMNYHRTTTLDDIYRHYAPNKVFKKKQEIHENLEDEGEIEEFEGELTGYTVPSRHSVGKISKPGKELLIADLFSAGTGYGGGGGGGGGYPSYGPPQVSYGPPMHHPAPPAMHAYPPTIHEQHIHLPGNNYHEIEEEEYYPVHHEKSKGHDLTIKDFFEIALTALAFLAFGLFIIQLLMYIHVSNRAARLSVLDGFTNENQCNAPLIFQNPFNATTTAAPTVIAADLDQRFKRQVLQARRPDDPLAFAGGNEELEQLARRVMRSIEAALVADADRGNCLRRALCEDNRYSVDRADGQRIWIPVWSLGMSWASGRVVAAPGRKWPAMLDTLKASLLGLGGADCASLYPDCQLRGSVAIASAAGDEEGNVDDRPTYIYLYSFYTCCGGIRL